MGAFTDVSAESGLNAAVGTGLGGSTADFDGDGLTDVFVANDMMVNQLWLNRGGCASWTRPPTGAWQ